MLWTYVLQIDAETEMVSYLIHWTWYKPTLLNMLESLKVFIVEFTNFMIIPIYLIGRPTIPDNYYSYSAEGRNEWFFKRCQNSL